MKYWNSRLNGMEEYVPGEQPENLDEYIKLNTNENPFPPSKAVLEALKNAADASLRRYPNPNADPLRSAFASANDLDMDHVFVGNGSDEIFSLLFRGFIEPEGKALFAYPSYSLYDTLAEMNGIRFDRVNLRPDFSFDMDAFLKKKGDLVIVTNPNNPTGTGVTVEQVRSFLGKYKGLLVVDEAYVDFYGGSCLPLVKEFDNIVVTRSFSKSYSLAGMRIGLALAGRDIIRGFQKLKDSYNVNRLAVTAAVAALGDVKSFRYNLEMVVNNKEYMEERLAGLGFETVPSRANFVFTRHPTVPAAEIYRRLKERKILVRYFTGPVRDQYVRISVGTMQEIKTLVEELSAITGS